MTKRAKVEQAEAEQAEEHPKDDKRVRYVGDGSKYVIGRPAVLGAIEAVTDEEAEALIETGLYEQAPDDAEPGVPANATAPDVTGSAEGGEPGQTGEGN